MIKAFGSLGEQAILSALRPGFIYIGHSCFEAADAPPTNKWDKILKLVYGQLNVFIANHRETFPTQVEIAMQVLENFKNNPNTVGL